PYNAPDYVILDESSPSADLNGWSVSVLRIMDFCTPVKDTGNVNYVESHSSGACTAALVCLTKPGETSVTDWVSCGSYAFPEKKIELSGKISVVMPEREPQRYISDVTVRSRSGKTVSTAIEVNKPLRIDGWKLYQLDFDRSMGRWSNVSVLEIIKDPWMTPVYIGIYLMIAGAVCMFVIFGRKKEEKR
ncbi:MAG: cytochrome c biogenesis protein ResB, partial [Alistipes sp.]|nr:cytochrome c biogenesis protein ResB [Candidatus Minthomonas equi]